MGRVLDESEEAEARPQAGHDLIQLFQERQEKIAPPFGL